MYRPRANGYCKAGDVDLAIALMSRVFRFIFKRSYWNYITQRSDILSQGYNFILDWTRERNVGALYAARVVSVEKRGIVLVSDGVLRDKLSRIIVPKSSGVYCLLDVPHCLKRAAHVPSGSWLFYDRLEVDTLKMDKIRRIAEQRGWELVDISSFYYSEIIFSYLQVRKIESSISGRRKVKVRRVKKQETVKQDG